MEEIGHAYSHFGLIPGFGRCVQSVFELIQLTPSISFVYEPYSNDRIGDPDRLGMALSHFLTLPNLFIKLNIFWSLLGRVSDAMARRCRSLQITSFDVLFDQGGNADGDAERLVIDLRRFTQLEDLSIRIPVRDVLLPCSNLRSLEICCRCFATETDISVPASLRLLPLLHW